MPEAESKENLVLAVVGYDQRFTIGELKKIIQYDETHIYAILRKFCETDWVERIKVEMKGSRGRRRRRTQGSRRGARFYWHITKKGWLILERRLLETMDLGFFKEVGQKIANAFPDVELRPLYQVEDLSTASLSVTTDVTVKTSWLRRLPYDDRLIPES